MRSISRALPCILSSHISFRSFGNHRKQNFETTVLNLSPSFRVLCSFAIVGPFASFAQSRRVVGLDGRKEEQVGSGTKSFHRNFRVNFTCFVLFFFSCGFSASLTESRSFWYGMKDLFLLLQLDNKAVLVLTVKTDDVTSDTKHVTGVSGVKEVDSKFVTWTIFHLCPVDNADFDFDDFCMHS